ncbi:hypothetical protein LOK49_LG06G00941 [Camellia lanceoleosa]|uniref:Uncharacterized protein n=1 Tax=Camellia lanceoleosa TaxID=1840588 RepID=A0ACC0HEX6_9ERIC|nr:hypothetical protein LOK49_LG06G00941 [Camellia lanceoleosa]
MLLMPRRNHHHLHLHLGKKVVNGLANELAVATEPPPSQAQVRSSPRFKKPGQLLLPQLRPPVPHLHPSPRLFLPQFPPLLLL